MREVRSEFRRRQTPDKLPLSEAAHHPHRAHEEIIHRRQDVGTRRDQSAEKAEDVLCRWQLEDE